MFEGSLLHPGIDLGNQARRNTSIAGTDYSPLSLATRRFSAVNLSDELNPLGLSLACFSANPMIDLVFVHGLGGTSKGTWSWKRDIRNFWPSWLHEEVALSRFRIFTFGYSASPMGQSTSLSILDFAKDLLFRMKTYSGKEEDGAPIGKVRSNPRFSIVGNLPMWLISFQLSLLYIRWEAWLSKRYFYSRRHSSAKY